jgi:hypothetical protein
MNSALDRFRFTRVNEPGPCHGCLRDSKFKRCLWVFQGLLVDEGVVPHLCRRCVTDLYRQLRKTL